MNERAVNAMLDFGKAVLEFIRKRATIHQIPTHIEERVVFSGEGDWVQKFEQKQSYWGFLKRHCDSGDLRHMPEAANAARILLEEEILQPPKLSNADGQEIQDPTFDQMLPHLITELLRVVVSYLEKTRMLDFDAEEFKRSYELHETSWLLKVVTWLVTVPLIGLESEVDRIELPNGLAIERFTPEDKTKLWTPFDWIWGFFGIQEFAQCKFKLGGSYQVEQGKPRNSGQIIRAAAQAITALRLLHAGDVGTAAAIRTAAPPYLGHVGSGATSMNDFRSPRSMGSTSQYRLEHEEVGTLCQILSQLANPQTQSQLRDLAVGLRRFNQAYSRERVEDKIIDLTIALESSLLSDQKEELRYRLATRGAAILSNRRDPEDTYSVLRALYDARSKIVHGGKALGEIAKNGRISGISANTLLPRAEQIAREVFREYLARTNFQTSLRMINETLDQTIVKSLAS